MADDPEEFDFERPNAEERMALGDPLESPPASPLDGEARSRPWSLGWVAIVLGGSLWVLRPGPATDAPPAASRAPTPATSVPSSPPPSLVLPPLDGSDGVIRDQAKGLSSHALYVLALGQKELIRTWAALVLNVAEGESPRAHLGFLAPVAGFQVIERPSGRLLLDPASYARYDAVAAAAASLDPERCAQVYRMIEPLFDAAYRELGHSEGGFSNVLRRALGKLLEVPILDAEVPLVLVEKPVVVYEYFDERIEALSVPQKHLLRMGPENVSRIQGMLRGLALALGFTDPSPFPTGAPPPATPPIP